MTGKLLALSLSLNVVMWVAYSTRLQKYHSIVEQQVNMGYRVNSLLLENNLAPDQFILAMLKDLGVR